MYIPSIPFWRAKLPCNAACYTLLALQTAYLKAHYPTQYMASVMKHKRKSSICIVKDI